MPWYDLRTMKRQPGGPSVSVADSVAFEAADDQAAMDEGYRRTRTLSPSQFALLSGPGNSQITTFEAPGA